LRALPGRTNSSSTGYRAIGVKAAGQVRLFSRNGKDFTRRFASIARALDALPDETVIDGEIIAYDTDGRPSFNVLQNRRTAGSALHLYVFDLLTLAGRVSDTGTAGKATRAFANQSDAAAAGFHSLVGNDGGIAGRIDRGGAGARFRGHRREAAR
jgi:ATP dependent DNA ligase domain